MSDLKTYFCETCIEHKQSGRIKGEAEMFHHKDAYPSHKIVIVRDDDENKNTDYEFKRQFDDQNKK